MAGKEWFGQAKFGMMIHWGLYSVLAGGYRNRRLDKENEENLGEWIMHKYRIPVKEYEKLAAAFNPVFFDASEWADLAKRAGMKYMVITAKHHEGFAMFKSRADSYNIVDASPFGRDVIKELSGAARNAGLKFGVYYSQELDWHEEHGGGYVHEMIGDTDTIWTNDWDFPDNDKKDYSVCFENKIKPQVKEILTNYGDIDLIWFDTPRVISPTQSRELYDMVKKYQPDCLVNSRIGNGMGDYQSCGDNTIPDEYQKVLYESPCTLNNTWGYVAHDNNWKDAKRILQIKQHLNERGINYLLNVGPDYLGRIPVPCVRILEEAGKMHQF